MTTLSFCIALLDDDGSRNSWEEECDIGRDGFNNNLCGMSSSNESLNNDIRINVALCNFLYQIFVPFKVIIVYGAPDLPELRFPTVVVISIYVP